MISSARFRLFLVVLLLLLFVIFIITLTTGQRENQEGFTFFGKIYREIASTADGNWNQVWSPLGLEVMLAILYAGAPGNESIEIRKALEWRGTSDEDLLRELQSKFESVRADATNFLNLKLIVRGFSDNELGNVGRTYRVQMQDVFMGDIQATNSGNVSGMAEEVNEWVKKETGGSVATLINSSDYVLRREGQTGTSMVLVNVLYFKAEWEAPFTITSPKRGSPFYTDTSKKNHVLTNFLSTKGHFYHANIRELSAEAVRIPFKGAKFSMIAVLPQEGSDLAFLEKKIAQGFQLTSLISQLERKEVVLHFPELYMETKINYREILENVAVVGSGFEKTQTARCIPQEDLLYVGALLQITAIRVGRRTQYHPYSFLRTKAGMRFDRPFIAYILDESTNITLLMFRKVN